MFTSQISRDEVRSAIEDKLCAHFAVTAKTATDDQVFQASAIVIREIMSRLLAVEETRCPDREVHYLSMEFLMGRSLMKNAFNLGIADALTGALTDLGRDASDIFEAENDAGLGNGGLGRLAACYMDSLATLGIPATGYSLCYELGIFRQKIVDGKQTEVADDWRSAAESWLVAHNDEAVEVRFGGTISPRWDSFGRYHAEHTGYQTVTAVPRDMLIAGYGGNEVNILRLWDARSTSALDMYLFSEGEYVKSLEQRTMSEVITKVLYPADDHIEGKTLRLKQQYFFLSATAQSIIKTHMRRFNDIRSFSKHHAIQINDTHPALVIPELMRIMMDEYGLGWDEAWQQVSESVAYTNHTVMSEALEKWPQDLVQTLLPRVWEILCEINRRWLAQANPRLHGLVSELLEGDEYLTEPEKLIGLLDFAGRSEVQHRVNEIKRLNKYDFAKFLAKNDGFALDPDAILDVQVKRLHEYKRQLMCAMLITRLQMRIHEDPNADFTPRSFVFGAKAAAGYYTAKRIIELICSLADDIGRDPLCKGKLQVCFMENYRVSAAEALMPAAQVSEQISTAGKEASGTGNMKLMLNGAVTIGTLDGANVEMYERLGDKNMFLFGLKADEVTALKASGYDPQRYAREDAELGAVLDRISRGFADGKSYSDLVSGLLYNGDPYMLCADYRDYVSTHDRMYSVISDPTERARLSITNTAEAGIFAADRAIKEYAEGIWGIRL